MGKYGLLLPARPGSPRLRSFLAQDTAFQPEGGLCAQVIHTELIPVGNVSVLRGRKNCIISEPLYLYTGKTKTVQEALVLRGLASRLLSRSPCPPLPCLPQIFVKTLLWVRHAGPNYLELTKQSEVNDTLTDLWMYQRKEDTIPQPRSQEGRN